MCFLTECCKTKTKAIAMASQKKENTFKNQWEPKVKTTELLNAWKRQGTKLWLAYSSLSSNCLRKWHKFSGPTSEWDKALNQIAILDYFSCSVENCSNIKWLQQITQSVSCLLLVITHLYIHLQGQHLVVSRSVLESLGVHYLGH